MFPRHTLLAVLIALIFASITILAQEQPAKQPDAKHHAAAFAFRDGAIHDGDISVCRYGNGYARDVRLSPGGKKLMTRFPWAWRFIKTPYDVMTSAHEKCDVEGQGTDRLVMHFTSEEPKKRFSEERTVILTYDAALDSYVFEIKTCLTVGNKDLPLPRNYIDVTDPYFHGMPGPACEGGPTTKWYNGCVYEAPDGGIECVPYNRLQSLKLEIYVKKNGRFIMHGAPEGRPTFQLLGDTCQNCSFEICHAIYDLHLVHRAAEEGAGAQVNPLTPFQVARTTTKKFLPAGSKYTAHYRVYQATQAEIDAMLERAKPRQLAEVERRDWSNMLVFYPGRNTFDTKLEPYFSARRGESDPWWWEPVDDESKVPELHANLGPAERPWSGNLKHCLWDRTLGHTDHYSVSVKRDKPGASVWMMQDFGPTGGWYFPSVSGAKQLTITAFVKTKDVVGKGAFVAADCPSDSYFKMVSDKIAKNDPGRGYESQKLTGINDWTKVTCVIPKRPGGRCVIQLRLEGAGQAWFDDVVVEEMKNRTE